MLFDISVSAPSGIESVTKNELYKLGYGELPAYNGRMEFQGGEKDIARCNLLLRTASRVYIRLKQFKAATFDELFEGIREISFSDYVAENSVLLVNGKCQNSHLMAVSACQSIIKKAVCESLSGDKNGKLDENGARVKIEFSIIKDVVSVYLDTSGEGLHKRGYRGLVGEAPLKENVAAALISLSNWRADLPFYDVFCGSGTLPIEACLMAFNIPSGFMRDFDYLHWKGFEKSVFEQVKQEAESKISRLEQPRIAGFDIDEAQIKLALKHLRITGLENSVHLQRQDMREFSTRYKKGVIISNPPYGERLNERREIERLYRDFGKMTEKLDGFSVFALSSVTDFERLYGKRADKKRKIYNGKLVCNYYSFYAKQERTENSIENNNKTEKGR